MFLARSCFGWDVECFKKLQCFNGLPENCFLVVNFASSFIQIRSLAIGADAWAAFITLFIGLLKLRAKSLLESLSWFLLYFFTHRWERCVNYVVIMAEGISSRVTRLNQLLNGKTPGRKVPQLDKDTLLDAFVALYHECNTDYMTKDKNIGTYVQKCKLVDYWNSHWCLWSPISLQCRRSINRFWKLCLVAHCIVSF